MVEEAIIAKLDTIEIDQEHYEDFVNHIKDNLDDVNRRAREARNQLAIEINRITKDKTDFIKKNLGERRSIEEDNVYQDELKRYDEKISFIEKEQSKVTVNERNEIMEFQVFVEILQNSSARYRKLNYVQKRNLIGMFFSNITVDNKKRLAVQANPLL
jgi:hypothetical protein